jgi:hypothetical protein
MGTILSMGLLSRILEKQKQINRDGQDVQDNTVSR